MSNKRPYAIILASISWFILSVLAIPYNLAYGLTFYSTGELILFIALILFQLACAAALWSMKKWGLVGPSLALALCILRFMESRQTQLVLIAILILAILLAALFSMPGTAENRHSAAGDTQDDSSSSNTSA